jgi:hypothetical protein
VESALLIQAETSLDADLLPRWEFVEFFMEASFL